MVYDLYKLCTNGKKKTVYALYQLYIATLIVTYDLIILFDNIRICFEILVWTGSYLKGVWMKYFSLTGS